MFNPLKSLNGGYGSQAVYKYTPPAQERREGEKKKRRNDVRILGEVAGMKREKIYLSWGSIGADEIQAVKRVFAVLNTHGAMREKELREKANVSSIGAIYGILRSEHGIGRIWDHHRWPDDNDKLYFLDRTVDLEWVYRCMQHDLQASSRG